MSDNSRAHHSVISLEVQNIATTTDKIASLLRSREPHQIKQEPTESGSGLVRDGEFQSFAQVRTSLFPETRCRPMCMTVAILEQLHEHQKHFTDLLAPCSLDILGCHI